MQGGYTFERNTARVVSAEEVEARRRAREAAEALQEVSGAGHPATLAARAEQVASLAALGQGARIRRALFGSWPSADCPNACGIILRDPRSPVGGATRLPQMQNPAEAGP